MLGQAGRMVLELSDLSPGKELGSPWGSGGHLGLTLLTRNPQHTAARFTSIICECVLGSILAGKPMGSWPGAGVGRQCIEVWVGPENRTRPGQCSTHSPLGPPQKFLEHRVLHASPHPPLCLRQCHPRKTEPQPGLFNSEQQGRGHQFSAQCGQL